MSQPVTIENDLLSLSVWPHIGGKVSSIIDKADKFDLMFNYPAELPPTAQYDIPYPNSWYAGWDECFPAVGKSPYTGHPYDGISVPDHGELWGLPTTAVPTKDGITTVWHGLRFGYRLTRKLYLEGPSLHAEYTLVNLAPFDFRFVWAMHGLMALTGPVEIDLGDQIRFILSHGAEGVGERKEFEWPNVDPGENLARPHELPQRKGWKVFSADPIAGPAIIRYPSRNRSVSISYASEDDLAAYWGIWINTGGWAGHHHFAIEPTTGRYDVIDKSIRDASAGKVPASGKINWAVTWTVG